MLSRPNNRIEGHPAAVDELNYGPFHPRYNLSLGRMERAYILRSLPLLKLGRALRRKDHPAPTLL